MGANAVNGVINIITKPAADTKGGLVTLQTGMFEKGSATARYGGALGGTAHYRLFTKYFTRSSLQDRAGNTPYGGWSMFRTGGRLDWSPSKNDTITLSGDWAQSTLRETEDEITSLTPPFESRVQENDLTKTGFVLTRWTRKLANGSELDGRFFYNRHLQSDALGHDKDQSIETADFEFNHHLRVRDRHDLVWGGGLRQVRDTVKPVFNTFFTPESMLARTYNGFVQDEIAFLGNSLRLTAGSKFEWNAFSKFEVQPTARLLWAATDRHSVWTAVSRAVRVPSREEHGQNELDSIGLDDNGGLQYSTVVASPLFKPEKLTAFEAGYRFVTPKRLSLDVAAFYNVYDDVQTLDVRPSVFTTSPIAGLLTPLAWTNHGYGRVLGAEVTAFWTVSPFLQISGNYTRLQMQLHADDADQHEEVHEIEAKNARNLRYARAYADLPQKVALAVELRYVGAIPGEEVPGYVDDNIHLSRAVREGLRLNVSLENFLHRRHAEWDGGGLVQSRAVRAGFTWSF